ncbi:MAG: alpha/beta hydrolase [Natronosporangium sp.]
MGGETTAYQQGVVEALRRAGAGPGDPVMLVGHSQGGVVAAQAAADLAGGGELNVTHVVTAGAPVGWVEIPDGVQLLALENAHDVAPHLDAAPNQDRPNQVTVTFETQHGTIAANHSMDTAYLPAGAVLDDSTDPSVVAFRDGAGAFFPTEGTTATATVFQIERSYPDE